MPELNSTTMKAVRLHSYGDPADVLVLEDCEIPVPGATQVRIRVDACALNPADGALCRGFAATTLPRGIGLDVSGTVDAIGEGVQGVSIGDQLFGIPDFRGFPSAGLAEYAVLASWAAVPQGLDLKEAAALTMVVETANRCIDQLGLTAGQTIFINGGGTMTGFGAVQIALMRGAHVIVSSGPTFAARLEALGAKVTPYGEGMVERVREIAGGDVDLALHTAQVRGVLGDLVKIVGGDPQRVLSISDFDEEGLGVQTSPGRANIVLRYDTLEPFAKLAAEGKFTVPIGRVFGLDEWREAMELSSSRAAHGKIVITLDA